MLDLDILSSNEATVLESSHDIDRPEDGRDRLVDTRHLRPANQIEMSGLSCRPTWKDTYVRFKAGLPGERLDNLHPRVGGPFRRSDL
jgi:hypothetical protein